MTHYRRWPAVLVLSVLVVLVAASAEALTTSHRFFGSFDFSAQRTWAWGEGRPAADRRVEEHVRQAVERELAKKGWTRLDDAGGAELQVKTQVLRDDYFLIGMLRLDVYHVGGQKMVFSAQAGSVRPDTLKKAKKVVDKAVRQMVKPLPKVAE